MRALLLTMEPWAASTRYRVLQYVPHLETAGLGVRVEPIPDGWRARLRLFRQAGEFDAVLLQKRLLPAWQTRLLRRRARRLAYDFDDAVPFRSPERGGTRSFTRGWRFRAVVRAADVVIAGNEYLRSLAVPWAPACAPACRDGGAGRSPHADRRQAVVIPTCLDPAKYDRAAAAPSPGPGVTLGWIGGRSTLPYLEALRGPLERVGASRPGVRLKIVCDAFFDLARLPVVKKPWREEDEAEDVASFDIGLAPTGEDAWSLGKCGLKVLQYMAASKPVVCTPAGVHREMVIDGVNGFWAEDADAWVERLTRLVDSADERRRMGAEGRKVLEARYTLAVNAPRFVAALTGAG